MTDTTNKTTDKVPAPSVRERLSKLAAHVAGLRTQAAALASDTADPVASVRRMADIAAELSAAAIVTLQLEAALDADDFAIDTARRGELDAKVAQLRPRESAAFVQVVQAVQALQTALDNLAAVSFELSVLGGVSTPGVGNLPMALSGLRQMWSLSAVGRSALGLSPTPDAKQVTIDGYRASIGRLETYIAALRDGENDANFAETRRLLRDTEASLKLIKLDLDVLLGKAQYPPDQPVDTSNMSML